MNRKTIGIFCSVSDRIDGIYFDSARRIGEWIGRTGRTLVYGGSNRGLMECVARAVKEQGGSVVGVIPAEWEGKGVVSACPARIVRTRNLSDRKDIIAGESDVLVALPGGIGTLDEAFHVMAAASAGFHRKKVVFYNESGYYDELLEMFRTMESKGFIRRSFSACYEVADTLEELEDKIDAL